MPVQETDRSAELALSRECTTEDYESTHVAPVYFDLPLSQIISVKGGANVYTN